MVHNAIKREGKNMFGILFRKSLFVNAEGLGLLTWYKNKYGIACGDLIRIAETPDDVPLFKTACE